MSKSMIDDVAEFLEKFKLPQREAGQPFNKEVILFRLSCLLEELQELSSALNNDDFAAATDALVDLTYFSLGTAHMLNLPFEQAWTEVHKANMRKIGLTSSRQSKRGSVLDIGKPKNWVGPNIEQFLAPEDRPLSPTKSTAQLDLEEYINSKKV